MAKKYVSLDKDLDRLIDTLENEPTTGTSMGNGLYKIRLGVASKNVGKRGGLRVITYATLETDEGSQVFLVEIYDKSEVADVPKKNLQKLVREIGLD